MLLFLVVIAAEGQSARPANAAVIFFTDRTVWEAAAGSISFTEDFEGFTVDMSFRTLPVALQGMTIQQEGEDLSFRNFVDVSPFGFTDNNGTTHASTFTNFPEGASPGTQVRIAFANLNHAFGGESTQDTIAEGTVLEVFNGATLLDSQVLAIGQDAFLGYVLTGGDVATSVRLRSNTLILSSTGEGFTYDNLAGVNAGITAVPEPSALILLGLGMLGSVGQGWWLRRRPRP